MKLFLIFLMLIPFSLFSGKRDDIVSTAKKFIGVRYKSRKYGNYVFDCSGYVAYVFSKNQINLPRSSDLQYEKAVKVPSEKAKEGDLVFFKIRKNKISHVGIYLGDGKFIHSPSTGKRIRIERMNQAYWKKRFVGFATYLK
ncbi:MAG: C40 family peptidase [Spirochaetes bacterium]|nr:C40 family peptidase [Spirochaetota bacterium]